MNPCFGITAAALLAAQVTAAPPRVLENEPAKPIYHSPQTPGYTAWTTLWRTAAGELRLAFQQVTGPVKPVSERINITVILGSVDEGATWKKLREVPARTNAGSAGDGIYAAPGSSSFCGHGLAVLKDGTLVTGLWASPNDKSGYVQRSTDDGLTWSAPIYLRDPETYKTYPTQIRPLRDGRLVLVAGTVKQADVKTAKFLLKEFFESRDDGKTWSHIWTMPADVGLCEESDFVELDNGDLLFSHRAEHYDGEKYVSSNRLQNIFHRKDDQWQIGSCTAMPMPHSGFPELLKTRDGSILHIGTDGIWQTGPDLHTWTRLDLPGSPYYPRATQLRDGRILVVGHVGGDDEYGKVDQTIVGQTFRLEESPRKSAPILGLTGKISDMKTAVAAGEVVKLLSEIQQPTDIDLTRMAEWALHYLTETPRKDLGYEPVFQCHPLQCPPVPAGQDPVVACDTDARMDWEWYFMRDITGSKKSAEVEAAFHQRIRQYVDPDGKVWSHPGCFNEGDIKAKYQKKDFVIHIWGATKILKSLSEDFARTRNPESQALARKVMLALKKIATWDEQGRCWIPCGMGALKADGSIVPNGWNRQPAPIVEPLVTYWLATGDREGLDFARAYANGMMNNLQPDGIRFQQDGKEIIGGFPFGAHSHATMHAVWGVAHLGIATGESRYVDFSKNVWDALLRRGTGTGWFPAGPDNCNETCCVSDMISVAALIAQSGHPEYFDYAERYLRNYIGPLQFIVTSEFEAYYRARNKSATEAQLLAGLNELRKFQGGIIGGSGLNDLENDLLGGASGYEMFGCCAPEGMRAIHTAWKHTIEHYPESPLGPAGVYINLSFTRDSKWGRVVSCLPEAGRLTVQSAVEDAFFLRPPHWAPREAVRAFIGTKSIPAKWSGDYVRFDGRPGDELTITYPLMEFTHEVEGLWKSTAPQLRVSFQWLGNMVVSTTPAPKGTPLFSRTPRALPPPPE